MSTQPKSAPVRPGPPPRRGLALAALGLGLAVGRPARAEDGASFKYADYREAGGRIAVKTQSGRVEQSLGTDTTFTLEGTIDTIVGATPNGQPAPAGSDQVVLTDLHDRRRAWDATVAHQFTGINVAAGLAGSRESDYHSVGWSLNTLADFNQKNTTLLVGVAGTGDDVKVFLQQPWARKTSASAVVGVTQLLDPETSVTANFTAEHAAGFLADQYKLVQKSVEVAPDVFLPFTYGENRPHDRDKWIGYLALNRAVPAAAAALEANYRLYHDSFGTTANTVELRWLQKVGKTLVLIPGFRFHTQTAADFYHYNLDATSIVPTGGAPHPAGPFYSSDYRLSQLRTTTVGLRAVWTPHPRLSLDAGVERYEMRGADGVTPSSAYPRATIVSAGGKWTW